MEIRIDTYELKNLMLEMAQLGAAEVVKNLGIGISDEISQREAYRLFGEARVKRWRREKKIESIKVGPRNSKQTYSRMELKALEKSEKLKGIYK